MSERDEDGDEREAPAGSLSWRAATYRFGSLRNGCWPGCCAPSG